MSGHLILVRFLGSRSVGSLGDICEMGDDDRLRFGTPFCTGTDAARETGRGGNGWTMGALTAEGEREP
jgi:hypothetical protein